MLRCDEWLGPFDKSGADFAEKAYMIVTIQLPSSARQRVTEPSPLRCSCMRGWPGIQSFKHLLCLSHVPNSGKRTLSINLPGSRNCTTLQESVLIDLPEKETWASELAPTPFLARGGVSRWYLHNLNSRYPMDNRSGFYRQFTDLFGSDEVCFSSPVLLHATTQLLLVNISNACSTPPGTGGICTGAVDSSARQIGSLGLASSIVRSVSGLRNELIPREEYKKWKISQRYEGNGKSGTKLRLWLRKASFRW